MEINLAASEVGLSWSYGHFTRVLNRVLGVIPRGIPHFQRAYLWHNLVTHPCTTYVWEYRKKMLSVDHGRSGVSQHPRNAPKWCSSRVTSCTAGHIHGRSSFSGVARQYFIQSNLERLGWVRCSKLYALFPIVTCTAVPCRTLTSTTLRVSHVLYGSELTPRQQNGKSQRSSS